MSTPKQTGALMRSRAREAALQYLYQMDFNLLVSFTFPEFVKEFFSIISEEDPSVKGASSSELSASAIAFAETIVKGVLANRDAIDGVIAAEVEHWSVARMTPVDRNVIRIATYEMLHTTDVPPRVAINEAINLAKKFGGEKSGAFVNSVLDKIRAHIESERK
ncbi:MAG: transcription antitermination factor NusB [Planctomycetota bacterium]